MQLRALRVLRARTDSDALGRARAITDVKRGKACDLPNLLAVLGLEFGL